MAVLDHEKPFYKVEFFDPESSELKSVFSPNIFLDTEKPSNNTQVSSEIYISHITVNSKLDASVNNCELEVRHSIGAELPIDVEQKVKVYFGFYDEDKSLGPDYSLVYTGYVTGVKNGLEKTIVNCKSSLKNITKKKTKITFSKIMGLDEIIKKFVIETGGLEEAQNGIVSPGISKQPGFGISDQEPIITHVKKIAKYGGLDIFLDVFDKFHASPWDLSKLKSPSADDTPWMTARAKSESENTDFYKHGLEFDTNLIDINFEQLASKYSGVEVVSFIPFSEEQVETIEPVKIEYKPSTDSTLPLNRYKITHVTREDAEKIAENLYNSDSGHIYGSVKLLGAPQIRVGDGIIFNGEGIEELPFENLEFGGAGSGEKITDRGFQVSQVQHKFDTVEGYVTTVGIIDPPANAGSLAAAGATTEAGAGPEGVTSTEAEFTGVGITTGEEMEEEEEEEELPEVDYLTLAGINFNFDSAVLLTRDLSDLKAIIEKVNRSEKKVLIAGHTDRMGSEEYNLNLSGLRAQAVLAVGTGNSTLWDSIINSGKVVVEDYQSILKDFGFYEGDIDGNADNTKTAVNDFQTYYNENYEGDIAVDGIIGPQTWDAIFRVMVKLLEVKISDEKFKDVKWIGCGEHYPIERPETDEVESEKNRRVEFLLYPDHEFPRISPPYASEGAKRAAYSESNYSFTETEFSPVTINLKIFEKKYWLRLAMKNTFGGPLVDTPYKLEINGETLEGTTDDDGLIEQEISAEAETGKLTIDDQETTLKIGPLDPVDSIKGWQVRLNNLGYDVGEIDGEMSESTRSAIKEFQNETDLKVDGIVGPKTQAKLKEVHGS